MSVQQHKTKKGPLRVGTWKVTFWTKAEGHHKRPRKIKNYRLEESLAQQPEAKQKKPVRKGGAQ